jgi:hypothetical protein
MAVTRGGRRTQTTIPRIGDRILPCLHRCSLAGDPGSNRCVPAHNRLCSSVYSTFVRRCNILQRPPGRVSSDASRHTRMGARVEAGGGATLQPYRPRPAAWDFDSEPPELPGPRPDLQGRLGSATGQRGARPRKGAYRRFVQETEPALTEARELLLGCLCPNGRLFCSPIAAVGVVMGGIVQYKGDNSCTLLSIGTAVCRRGLHCD